MKLKGPAPFIVPPKDPDAGNFWAEKKAAPKTKRKASKPTE